MQIRKLCALVLLFSGLCLAQAVTQVSGALTDPSGALIPGATVVLENTATGARREVVSDSQGRYSFPQVAPGAYRITARAQGFGDVSVSNVRLLVNTPAVIDIKFEKVGAVSETVSVTADTTQVNTQDASIGNAIGDRPILQLPFEARNVVGLLSLQPGVSFIGETPPGVPTDYRQGAVNGGKSDQANVTLDGVDVNDQQNRSAFNSVLRVTLDSVQEFRTITANANADFGRTSGAQVSLVTKSGSNSMHGSVYWFLRNTATSANDFFNNQSGTPREKLNRNIGGASLGGPIKKNRLFYFLNYEGRRDRSEKSVVRVVPTANFRNGQFAYQRRSGGIGFLGPDDFRRIDPLGIGQSPGVLAVLRSYPLPNDTTTGDALNTAGFRFNANAPVDFNTYIAKFDYNIDESAKHQLFVRGNLQNDRLVPAQATSLPQFPGEPGNDLLLDNSKGLAIGYTGLWKSNLVSTFRYGLTRQGTDILGIASSNFVTFRNISPRFGINTTQKRITPVHQLSQDFAWTKGAHSITFGAVGRMIQNNVISTGNSFSNGLTNANYLLGSGREFDIADAVITTPYRRQFANLLGLVTQITANYNYDLQGNLLQQGTPIQRAFASNEFEAYIQDVWKVTRNLTITAGLRYSLMPPVHEVGGFQTTPIPNLAEWSARREALANAGLSQTEAGEISFVLADSPNGRSLYPFHKKNFGPRLALAWSPDSKTSIRAGFGLFYDLFGQGILRNANQTSLGLSSQLQPPPTFSPVTAPRFVSFGVLPSAALPPAPPGGFPIVQPENFAIANSVDDRIRPPYSMNLNFSMGREFAGGLFGQVAYVGRLSRRSLLRSDLAMPTNLRDPRSGMTYFEAASILTRLARAGTPTAQVAPVAFWENMWPAAAGNGLTATQAIFRQIAANDPDTTTALVNFDLGCVPACSRLGPAAIFNTQFSSLGTQQSVGNGNYNALQLTVRKRFSQGVQFDVNYTWSKSIDLGSTPENNILTTNGSSVATQVVNSWDRRAMRGVSDFDQTHILSAFVVAELPFGKGKKFGGNANSFLNALIGGWQATGIWRQSSGLPTSIFALGVWPTNWNISSFAVQTRPFPTPETNKNAPSAGSGPAGPNLFEDPAFVFNSYEAALPGGSGQRNGVRGDGFFGVDVGLAKRFQLFVIRDNPHTLQFRVEGFNITNTVSFDPFTANVDINNPATFGKYTTQLGTPRVFQFALRYEF